MCCRIQYRIQQQTGSPHTAYHSRTCRDTAGQVDRRIDNTLNTLICGMKHVNVVEHTKEQHKNGIYFEKIRIINISTDIG